MSLSVDERPCRRLQGLGAASLLKGTHDGSAHEGRALARAGQPVHLADDGVVELYVLSSAKLVRNPDTVDGVQGGREVVG